jgi:phosphoglycerate dehydrogenase-like enzyme
MKILLIKTEGETPLEIKDKHLEKILDVDKSIKVTAVSSIDKRELASQITDAEVVSSVPGVIPSIKGAKSLKWIHAFSAGVEKVLTEEVVKSNVIVSNSSGIHAIPIAEHVLGFMLIFTRKFYDTFKKQQEKIWQSNQDITEVRGKTALVVGLGHIGTEVARMSCCLGVKVLAVKQNIKNKSSTNSVLDKPDSVHKLYAKDDLEEALPKADFVVLCLPLTSQTHHLFDMKKFKLMKKSGVLINIGRGGVVNEKELIEALDKKIIGGAALDVTETEPLPKESKLWNMENVVITPHHSGLSEKYMDRAIDLFCLNLKAYIKGEPLPNLVDKKRGY